MEPALRRVGRLDHRARSCGRQCFRCLAASLACKVSHRLLTAFGQGSEAWSLLYEGWEAGSIALDRAAGSVTGVWLPLLHVNASYRLLTAFGQDSEAWSLLYEG